jgi:hypothetical protein
MGKSEAIPWLQLSPASPPTDGDGGGGGGLGAVSFGKGGINLQLSFAGRRFTAFSATKQ